MATSLRYRLPPLTLLAASIASALWASTSAAQSSDPCSVSPAGNIDCNITGTYAKPVDVFLESEPDDALPPVFVRSNAVIDARAYPELVGGLLIQAKGKDGGDARPNGEDALGLTVENTGDIKLQAAENAAGNVPVFGLLAQLRGGDATSNGGNGGAAGGTGVSLVNSGSIDMSGLSSDRINGGAGVAGIALGGDGAGSSGSAVGNGAGGGSSAINLFNHGDVTASVRGDGLFSGVLAASRGGTGADFVDGGRNSGGDADGANLLNEADIVVDRTWIDLGASETSALFGVLAQSQGGNGGASSGQHHAGEGGWAISASVDVRPGASVHVTQRIADSDASANAIRPHGAGVAVLLTGGDGGDIAGHGGAFSAGNGGEAGFIGALTASLQIEDADVVTSGLGLPALLLRVRGGSGGEALPDDGSPGGSFNHGGHGGNAGDANVLVMTKQAGLQLSTDGASASAIETLQQGGAGGDGAGYLNDIAAGRSGDGGSGGSAGALWVSLDASPALPVTITTTGTESHGLYARQLGGEGGDAGATDELARAAGTPMSTGGAGGSTNTMKITVKNTAISTSGSRAFGIFAQSRAADGGRGAVSITTGKTLGAGGAGGSTGNLTVSLDAASSLLTRGTGAVGLFAQTASGAGGNPVGNSANSQVQDGAGGNTGDIEVLNHGSITTQGVDAIGILAQALAGSAGGADTDDGLFGSAPQSGSSVGRAGWVYLTHSGTLTTEGDTAHGVVAQSLGGGGGVALGRRVAALGGTSTTTALRSDARGAQVNADSSGSLRTQGTSAIGILAQSIGGGGGLASGIEGVVKVGSQGGGGGRADLTRADLNEFLLSTTADSAHGVVAQSIGGGGGVLSNAHAQGWFESIELGQTGGEGGV
ncbi:hypothetical protein GOQ25_10825, partial [Bordetella sp. 15P40C-2]|nr:hypothetical protein [Bordetella sp. 15P40C-2]